ncbi:hypothetical protein [Sulfuriferula sp.]|uniref:hypothetical protein n=1 Tax=Sulfuriferula sp. TaxID=2025307 RepID=UPI00272F2AB0|nr:hypothetical protein [Sulfuriferula sp.]MDP2027506.1 hypothetical protein [Sulfuriferula sp.]
MMKAEQLIDAEIVALTEMKLKVPPESAFGDNNLDAIEAQKTVLLRRMGTDEIQEAFGGEDEFSKYILDGALIARDWLFGEGVAPSQDWPVLEGRA